ncbi:MAG: hypothetical protein AAF384_06355, partial [Pseudomonadota bacterium]
AESGVRNRIDLSGAANGPAYIDIVPHQGATLMVGRFAGVIIDGVVPKIMGAKRFAINHLLAERGALGFPFPKGTGWSGLLKRVEAG